MYLTAIPHTHLKLHAMASNVHSFQWPSILHVDQWVSHSPLLTWWGILLWFTITSNHWPISHQQQHNIIFSNSSAFEIRMGNKMKCIRVRYLCICSGCCQLHCWSRVVSPPTSYPELKLNFFTNIIGLLFPILSLTYFTILFDACPFPSSTDDSWPPATFKYPFISFYSKLCGWGSWAVLVGG